MIKSKIDKLLSAYFYNYDSRNLSLAIFSGRIVLQNLYLNTEKINQDLQLADVPIRLKSGLLSNLKIDISIMNLQLNLLSIDNLILILEPCPEHLSNIEEVHTTEEKNNFMTHLLQNFERYKKG